MTGGWVRYQRWLARAVGNRRGAADVGTRAYGSENFRYRERHFSDRGGRTLSGAVHPGMPDRIEMGAVASAAAITDGVALRPHGRLDLLGVAAPILIEAGVDLRQTAKGITARRSPGGLVGIDIQTRPYPGFATDLQAPVTTLLSTADGRASARCGADIIRMRRVLRPGGNLGFVERGLSPASFLSAL
jgi:hypothetical protein